MRKLEFRAWDIENKRMVDTDEITYGQWHDTTYFHPNALSEYIIMQYTNLKDSKGNRIYEGDIVKGKNWMGKFDAEVVEYRGCHYYPFDEDEESGIGWNSCEVIGNVYENPNLLKHKK